MSESYIYLLSGVAFVATVLFVEGLYLMWRGSQTARSTQARKRLRKLSAGGVPVAKAPSLLRREALSANPVLNEIYLSIPRLKQLDRLLERAAPNLTLTGYFAIIIGVGIVLFVILLFIAGLGVAGALLFSVPIAILLPYLVLNSIASRYLRSFNEQLPDAIDYIARSLRAGNPFSASLKSISEDMGDPIASEFGTTFDEMRYGVDTEDALEHLMERTESDEVKFFVTAVLVQRTTGGNLAKTLDRLSAVMRARANTFREIKVMSSEMRLSANILVVLPFVVAGVLSIVNPEYIGELLGSRVGLMIVGGMLALMAIGYYWMHKMASFRV